jgi:hypothetical protein
MGSKPVGKVLVVAVALAGAVAMFELIRPAASAPAPGDTAACQRTSAALTKQAEALQKRTRIQIPREFVRVSANLDEYCQDKEFDKAQVSIEWMETCIKGYRRPYNEGRCTRNRVYFCAIDPKSDACKG